MLWPLPVSASRSGKQVAPGLGPVDQMMVRIDDRQLGFDDASWRRASQSGRTARCELVAVAGDVVCISSPWQKASLKIRYDS